MTYNRTKVESNAIDVIRCIVDKNDRLLPDPSFGDRGISTDGYIQLFESDEVDKGENLLRLIPIQIKGRTDKSKKLVRLNATKNKLNVDTKDIQNYYRQGGAIFFFVYFDEGYEEHAVFYSVLMPVKCKRYLEIATKNKLDKVPVSFEKMDETGAKIFELCAQFHEEQNKQGFGGGTIMQHIVSWEDIKGETTLTTSAVGANSTLDILKRVVRGDIHLYAKDGAVTVPVEWIEGGRILQYFRYEHPVFINDEKYYDYVDVEIDIETKKQRLHFGNTIIVDVDTAKFTFIKDNRSYNDLAKASRFLLALSTFKCFVAGGISLKLCNLDIGPSSKEELEVHIEIDKILKSIGLDSVSIVNRENDIELRKQLFLLWEIANHRKDQFFTEIFTHFDWSLEGKKYPLVIVRNDVNVKNDIYSFLFTSKYQTFCESENGEHYPVPTFAFPSYDVMRKLYSYDVSAFEEQIRRVPVNEDTREYVNMGALKLLCLYDASGDHQVLAIADELFEKLSTTDNSYDYVVINRLQTKKRIKKLGTKEIEKLIEISKCGEAIFEFAANVLLDDATMATQKYNELNEGELRELEGTPLLTLYHKLIDTANTLT